MLLKIGLTILAALVIYFTAWPVPIEPQVWDAPTDRGYQAPFEANQKLSRFKPLTMGQYSGPEAAVIASDNDIVATSHEGWLIRFKPDQYLPKAWVETGGRPLGLDQDSEGNFWIANAYLGLQKVTPDGEVSLLLSEVDGSPITYADDVVAAPNGKVYFTDATQRFPAKDWGGTLSASFYDVVEHGKTGRVIEYDPVTKKAKVVLPGLSFANGITVDPDGEFLLINETWEYRVWKLWIAGSKQGQAEVIIDNLPGFPDNINQGRNGVFWLGLVSPRAPVIDKLDESLFMRKLLMRMPSFIQPSTQPYAMVVAIDGDGQVIHNLQDPSGQIFTSTGAVETESHIFVTSLTADFLAKVSKVDAGITE